MQGAQPARQKEGENTAVCHLATGNTLRNASLGDSAFMQAHTAEC